MAGFGAKNADCMSQLEYRGEGTAFQSSAAAPSPGLFYCYLDDQPDHLVPEFALRTYTASAEDRLFFNPRAWFTQIGEPPLESRVLPGLLDTFALQGSMVWITDPGGGAMRPFWLGAELGRILDDLQPGDPAPSNITPATRNLLSMADVLVAEDYISRRRAEWAESVARWAVAFRGKGYVPVRGLIHPFHIAALRRYYRHRIRVGGFHLGDAQSSRRYVAHNESVARFFHHQLTAAVMAVTGEPVKPSYVYFASYLDGAKLEKHIDREQCEFSITLCLDYSPEPPRAAPWPIHLQTPRGQVTVFQALGDGLLYRGGELPHFRDVLPKGHTSTSLFFHYVRTDFTGSLT